jgi:hypothetical protein
MNRDKVALHRGISNLAAGRRLRKAHAHKLVGNETWSGKFDMSFTNSRLRTGRKVSAVQDNTMETEDIAASSKRPARPSINVSPDLPSDGCF